MSNVSAGQSVRAHILAGYRLRRSALDMPGIAALMFVHVAIGFALLYFATVVWGVIEGYALPTAAVFHIVPHAGFITRIEDDLPYVMLLLALAGAVSGWLKYWRPSGAASIRHGQLATLRLLRRSGLLLAVTAAILMLSSPWSGLVLGNDFQYASIGGLVPHSDASNYFLGTWEQIITGSWSGLSSHRPFAAAFRQLTMGLAGLSYAWTLALQAILVAAAFFAAARSIALWRGLWCAFGFSAFGYLLIRPFITSLYTESLGLFWGFVSVMFFVESMRSFSQSRRNSLGFAFLALMTITVGEMTRMGSMFTIPAFVLWISLAFSSTVFGRIRLFAIASGLVLLVLGIQAFLSALYASPGTASGGNFAYTLCGLSVAGDWTTCPKLYAGEFSRLTSEDERTAFLFSRALADIAQNPVPMLGQMVRNIGNLIKGLPGFLMFSYLRDRDLSWWPFLFLAPGFYWTLRYRATRGELIFWPLIFLSVIASAAIIFADDGWRVFYASWPFVALFFSLGFAAPGVLLFPAQSFQTVSLRRGTAFVGILICLIVIGPAASRAFYAPGLEGSTDSKVQLNSDEGFLLGRSLTGFAVISDDKPLPLTVPAMHVSDFRRVADRIGIERDFGKFVDVIIKHVPFAFITGARIDNPANQAELLYVAPIEILSRPADAAWKVTLGHETSAAPIRDILAYQPLLSPLSSKDQQPQ